MAVNVKFIRRNGRAIPIKTERTAKPEGKGNKAIANKTSAIILAGVGVSEVAKGASMVGKFGLKNIQQGRNIAASNFAKAVISSNTYDYPIYRHLARNGAAQALLGTKQIKYGLLSIGIGALSLYGAAKLYKRNK